MFNAACGVCNLTPFSVLLWSLHCYVGSIFVLNVTTTWAQRHDDVGMGTLNTLSSRCVVVVVHCDVVWCDLPPQLPQLRRRMLLGVSP